LLELRNVLHQPLSAGLSSAAASDGTDCALGNAEGNMKTILVIEDDEGIRSNILDLLEAEGFDGIGAADGAQGLAEARRAAPDLIVCDIMMPVLDGLALLERVRADPELTATPFILLTARADRSDVRTGMSKGADDYVSKPFTREELLDAIHMRLRRREVVASTQTPQGAGKAPSERNAPLSKRRQRHTAIVRSDAMRSVYLEAERAAQSPISVLLLGETGVGKEVLAYDVHRRSPRCDGPFVPLNCAALSPTLLESELFGHEKGSFTGAAQAQPGLFEMAHGGTVFLDEIGELDPAIQVKLLRVLEDKLVLRVGSRQPRQVDVRFVSATNRDLESEVAAGRFRQDLFFRLNGITLEIPALRERRAEIAPLSEHFCQLASDAQGRSAISITPQALALLEKHEYPGNVRELKNIIDRAVALCRGDAIELEHLPPGLRGEGRAAVRRTTPMPNDAKAQRHSDEGHRAEAHRAEAHASPADEMPQRGQPESSRSLDELRDDMAELDKRRIVAALDQCAGNQTKAAQLLGISRRTLVSRLDTYDLPRPRKDRKS
jgi:DNA-binding NtrC family response regulator